MYFETNIEYLTMNEYNWVAPIDSCTLNLIFKGSEPNGTAYFEYSDGKVANFSEKLDEQFKNRMAHKEILIIFGVFALKEIMHLYQTKNKDTLIIVIEPNMSVFNYVLNNKNMKIFAQPNIILFADSNTENIITFIQPIIHEIDYARLLKKVNFYFTEYYRNNANDIIKPYIQLIRQTILGTVRAFGNDVIDSLIGLERNLKNLPFILKSKDMSAMQGLYKDKPAIIVAAGPSLNKNFHLLKEAKGKAVIVAVDTIVERLLAEGIVPDFVCSIERSERTYEFFYKDSNLPKEVTLVAPAVIETRILEEYKGEVLLPFRNEIAETLWLQNIMDLPLNSGIYMGSSCAHVAFGIAEHLGCSPLILVGQDLAFSEDKTTTHATGTIYRKLNRPPISKDRHDITEGYYGGEVTTTDTWRQFKVWFEKRIGEADLKVIDATEGGARIYLTERATLKHCIDTYCKNKITPMIDKINQIGTYPIELSKLKSNLERELEYYEAFLENIIDYFNRVEKMEVTHKTFLKYDEQLSVVHYIIKDAMSNSIIMHNLQSTLLKYLWSHNSREQIVSREYVQEEKNEQIKLLGVMAKTIYEIKQLVQEAYDKLNEVDLNE